MLTVSPALTGTFTAPAGSAYFNFVFFWTDLDRCSCKVSKGTAADIIVDDRALPPISSTDYNAYPMYVSIENNVIEMTYKYGTSYDMTVQMQKQGGLDPDDQPVGGNQLFDFCRWYLTSNPSSVPTSNPDTSSYYKINGTDYFGPYRVRAVNNPTGDMAANDDFTGGNHQYNNSGSGSTPTARTASIVFTVDGKTVTSYAGYAREIKIDWVNYVQANNTKKSDGTGREVLTEHYTVKFDGKRFNVENVIEALEEINIYTYYGMQALQMYSASGLVDPLYYLGSKAEKARQPRNTITSAVDKYCREMMFVGQTDVLDMFMEDVGLGDFAYATLTGSDSSAFSSTGKLYFNLINKSSSDGLILQDGDIIYYRGWYEFYPKAV